MACLSAASLDALRAYVRAWQVRCHQGMSNARTLLSDHLMADLHAQVSKCITCPSQMTCPCQGACPFQLPVPHICRGVGEVRCVRHVQ